jgi:hypothetical protein
VEWCIYLSGKSKSNLGRAEELPAMVALSHPCSRFPMEAAIATRAAPDILNDPCSSTKINPAPWIEPATTSRDKNENLAELAYLRRRRGRGTRAEETAVVDQKRAESGGSNRMRRGRTLNSACSLPWLAVEKGEEE